MEFLTSLLELGQTTLLTEQSYLAWDNSQLLSVPWTTDLMANSDSLNSDSFVVNHLWYFIKLFTSTGNFAHFIAFVAQDDMITMKVMLFSLIIILHQIITEDSVEVSVNSHLIFYEPLLLYGSYFYCNQPHCPRGRTNIVGARMKLVPRYLIVK